MQRLVLPNGLTVLHRHDRSAPVVAIVTWVNAGYFDETDDVTGISHVLEHMYFKGTPTRKPGDIARETRSLGGYLNAHTSYDHTMYYTVLPSRAFRQGLEIQCDAYRRSTVDAQELSRELEVIVQEAHRKLDNPSAVAVETVYQMLHDSHRIRRWRIGTEEQLRKLTRKQLLAFHGAYYIPGNTVLSIVGDVPAAEVFSQAEELYGDIPAAELVRDRGAPEDAPAELRYRELQGDVSRSRLVLGWRGRPALHAAAPELDMLGTILSGGRSTRLYKAVRDTGLSSAISASHHSTADIGVFSVHAEIAASDAGRALAAVAAQLAEVASGDLDSAEVTRAQRMFESRLYRRLETMEGQAAFLAEWEACGSWELGPRYVERSLLLNARDIATVAEEHLHPAAASVLLYRPAAAKSQLDVDQVRTLLTTRAEAPFRVPQLQSIPGANGTSKPELLERAGDVLVFVTRNGVPILVRRKQGTSMLHVAFHALGGAIAEAEPERGLTTLLGRTAIRGTRSFAADQLSLQLELLGAALSPGTGLEGFGWSISAPAGALADCSSLLAEVVQWPGLERNAVETERAVILSQLRQQRDDMQLRPMRLAFEAAYGSHPYGRSATGTEDAVGGIGAERLAEWHNAAVLRSSCVLAIVGDDDEAAMATMLAARFGQLARVADSQVVTPAWSGGGEERGEERDKEQTAFAVLYPSPGRLHPDRHAAAVLATLCSGLGGRLFMELRDRRSLAYTVHARSGPRRLGGAFAAYIATAPERESEAREAIHEELRRIATEGVTGEEVARAVEYLVGARSIRLQSGSELLSEMLDAYVYGEGLAELQRYESSLRAVTGEGIQRLAGELFDPAVAVTGVVRGRRS